MMGIWTAFLLAALCASALAWVAALLHERGVNPLRRLRAARPSAAPFQTALLAIVAIGFIHHGATKSTNGIPDPGEPPDPDPPPPPPNPPSVSVSFDTDVVIFEDGYEDSPGVFVPRHSTMTKLTVTARGGDTGASLDLTIVGGLEKCAGQSEMPTYVAPNQTFEWHANYEGVSASSSQGDIIATVTATSGVVGVNSEPATANATAVKVTVTPTLEVPENNLSGRHMLGVCEEMTCSQQHGSIETNLESNVGWQSGNILWMDPFGWNVTNVTGTASEYGQFATDTTQTTSLTADGTVTIQKFGHEVVRGTNGIPFLNGVMQNVNQ